MKILNEKKWNSSINDFCFISVPRTGSNGFTHYLTRHCERSTEYRKQKLGTKEWEHFPAIGADGAIYAGSHDYNRAGIQYPVFFYASEMRDNLGITQRRIEYWRSGTGYVLNSKADSTIKFTGHLPMRAKLIIDPESQELKKQDEDFFDKVITFGTVRNPWDRLVSLAEFSRQDGELCVDSHKWTDPDKKTMIKRFVKHHSIIEENRELFSEEEVAAKVVHAAGLQVKSSYIKNLTSQLEWFKINNKIRADVILEYDNYLEDIDKLSERMSLLQKKELPSKLDSGTASQRSGTEDYYDQESYEMVRELYKEEIEMFNFKLDGYE